MKLKPIRILAGTRSYRGFWLFRVRVERELHQTETDSMPIEVRLATLSSRYVAPLDRQAPKFPTGALPAHHFGKHPSRSVGRASRPQPIGPVLLHAGSILPRRLTHNRRPVLLSGVQSFVDRLL